MAVRHSLPRFPVYQSVVSCFSFNTVSKTHHPVIISSGLLVIWLKQTFLRLAQKGNFCSFSTFLALDIHFGQTKRTKIVVTRHVSWAQYTQLIICCYGIFDYLKSQCWWHVVIKQRMTDMVMCVVGLCGCHVTADFIGNRVQCKLWTTDTDTVSHVTS